MEKKKEYAAPKNVWFGEWEPVKKNSAPTSSIVISSTAHETAMLDADTAISKKIIERKMYP